MEIIKRGRIDNYAKCAHCGTKVRYNKYDLHWTHTEENCYYLICPLCHEMIWVDKTPELDKAYNEVWVERHPKDV